MGSANQTRYVDADRLVAAIQRIYPAVGGNYSSGLIDQQVNQIVSSALSGSLEMFKQQIIGAIQEASQPYDKCMLCVQRDSCIPPDPRLP